MESWTWPAAGGPTGRSRISILRSPVSTAQRAIGMAPRAPRTLLGTPRRCRLFRRPRGNPSQGLGQSVACDRRAPSRFRGGRNYHGGPTLIRWARVPWLQLPGRQGAARTLPVRTLPGRSMLRASVSLRYSDINHRTVIISLIGHPRHRQRGRIYLLGARWPAAITRAPRRMSGRWSTCRRPRSPRG